MISDQLEIDDQTLEEYIKKLELNSWIETVAQCPPLNSDEVRVWLKKWFISNVPALGFVTPHSLMGTQEGAELVRHALHCSLHSVYC